MQGNPRAAKQTVIVQQWVSGKWVNTLARHDRQATTSGRRPSRDVEARSWTLRAFVAGDTTMGIYPGYSAAKRVTIK